MGLFNHVGNVLVKLISDDPEQYVMGEDKFENAIVMGMNAKGEARISSGDAAILAQSRKKADEYADNMDKSQMSSIVVYASDMVIRAKNGLERWIKEKKLNKKLSAKLDASLAKQGDLPKDDMVRRAEKRVETKAAGELENKPREKGGRARDSRTK